MFPLDPQAREAALLALARVRREYRNAAPDEGAIVDDAIVDEVVSAYLIAWLSKRALEELLGEDPQTARRAA